MKNRHFVYLIAAVTAVSLVGSLNGAAATPAAGTNTVANPPLAGTNAVAAAQPIPQSLFTIPTSKEEGRDPFFPKSDRLLAGSDPGKPAAPTPVFTLVLNGLSGAEGHRLAMINGYTLASGEEGDVPTPAGRVRVRCVTIRNESALVEVAGEKRELHLHQSH